jgi:uracil-DNA glycosylase
VTGVDERAERIAELDRYHREEVSVCTRCDLARGRTTVVLGSGDPDADLMFVGEAPGYHEDQQGVPFVGQAGKLLAGLLEGIGLDRERVFIANVLKCRPPDNRNPRPEEIAACEPHLFRQIQLIRPLLVCTLGNFATRLLSGRPEGITRMRGCELPMTLAGRPLLLYPLFHPAAALYARATLSALEEDFARIPVLLERAGVPGARAEAEGEGLSTQVQTERRVKVEPAEQPARPAAGGSAGDSGQLGLF